MDRSASDGSPGKLTRSDRVLIRTCDQWKDVSSNCGSVIVLFSNLESWSKNARVIFRFLQTNPNCFFQTNWNVHNYCFYQQLGPTCTNKTWAFCDLVQFRELSTAFRTVRWVSQGPGGSVTHPLIFFSNVPNVFPGSLCPAPKLFGHGYWETQLDGLIITKQIPPNLTILNKSSFMVSALAQLLSGFSFTPRHRTVDPSPLRERSNKGPRCFTWSYLIFCLYHVISNYTEWNDHN